MDLVRDLAEYDRAFGLVDRSGDAEVMADGHQSSTATASTEAVKQIDLPGRAR